MLNMFVLIFLAMIQVVIFVAIVEQDREAIQILIWIGVFNLYQMKGGIMSLFHLINGH